MKIIVILTLAISAFSQTVSLDNFLNQVKENHPLFRKEKRSVEIEEKKRQAFLGSEDWILSASPYYSHIKPISSGPFTPETVDNFGFEAKMERLFWSTGGNFSVSWSSGYTNQDVAEVSIPGVITIPGGPAEIYQHGLYLSYSHPFMQNKGGFLNRLNYDLAEYAIENAKIQSAENQELFLLQMALNFLQWALLDEQIHISNERLNLAREQFDQISARRKANLVDEVDVYRAEDAIRITRQNILLMQAQWKGKQAELATLAQSDELINQKPDYNLFQKHEILSFEEVKDLINTTSRPIQSLKIFQKNINHQRDGFVELAKPQLSLNVRAGLAQGDDELGNSMVLDKPDYLVGMQFSYPLDNTTAKIHIEETDLQILQLNDETRQAQLNLEANARNLLVRINEILKVLELNLQQIESAKLKTEEEDKLYRQGRGQLTFVIQSRDNEENARFTYAQNAALYQNLVLQYKALIDDLVQ